MLSAVVTMTAIGCKTELADSHDDPRTGLGGADTGGIGGTASSEAGGLGGNGTGGSGGDASSCTPKLYQVAELCAPAYLSRGFVWSSIPDDPLHNPQYVCTSQRPFVSFADGKTALFRYRQGCGLTEWELLEPGPPWATLVAKIDGKELVGCKYAEDVPLAEQCGSSARQAGVRFECEDFEQDYCVLGNRDATVDGAADAGGDGAGGSAGEGTVGHGGQPHLELCGIAVSGGCVDGVIEGMYGHSCSEFSVTCKNGCSAQPKSVPNYFGDDRSLVNDYVSAAYCEPDPSDSGTYRDGDTGSPPSPASDATTDGP